MGKLSKDRRDVYYRKAKEEGFRARSAYKLLDLDNQFGLFNEQRTIKRVVDLCAAPGSWSQVVAEKLRDTKKDNGELIEGAYVVAVDLQEMAPIEGVDILKGDITSKATAGEIINKFKGEKAQLVICDGAPDVTGLHDMDEFIQAQLLVAALNLATFVLEPQGTFVAKIFRGRDVTLLYNKFEMFFTKVTVAKPMSSRSTSLEAFIVCENFKLPTNFTPSFDNNDLPTYGGVDHLPYKSIANFVACGDLNGLDSNKTYQLSETSEFLPPNQAPIKPPYQEAIDNVKRKNNNKNTL